MLLVQHVLSLYPSVCFSFFLLISVILLFFFFFFFNDTATTEIYTLSLHDALPISTSIWVRITRVICDCSCTSWSDRKSTRLNSSHLVISYAVFCLKKKKKKINIFFYVENWRY